MQKKNRPFSDTHNSVLPSGDSDTASKMQMPKLKADSAVSRRIVEAFTGFLSTVEPAPGDDLGGVEVTAECLREVFKTNSSPTNNQLGLELMGFFESLPTKKQGGQPEEGSSSSRSRVICVDVPWRLYAHIKSIANSQGEHSPGKLDSDFLRNELCERFRRSLENQDAVSLNFDMLGGILPSEKATQIALNTANEMKDSGCLKMHNENVAETLKSKGNKAVESRQYNAVIELYTVAIALCFKNPIYFCNRAAAYTLISKYDEAIKDCLQAIELDPNYCKAYSRLGTAYYALGKYSDAIEKGFRKALELNPDSPIVKEKLQEAEQKLEDELRQSEEQNPSLNEGPGVQSPTNQN